MSADSNGSLKYTFREITRITHPSIKNPPLNFRGGFFVFFRLKQWAPATTDSHRIEEPQHRPDKIRELSTAETNYDETQIS